MMKSNRFFNVVLKSIVYSGVILLFCSQSWAQEPVKDTPKNESKSKVIPAKSTPTKITSKKQDQSPAKNQANTDPAGSCFY